MKMILRIGTRPSPLALKQVEEIRSIFAQVKFETVIYQTPGDRDRLTPISDVEATDFFTRDLDEALVKNEIDLAVHSSKDLPAPVLSGLKVIFETRSISPLECLVSRSAVKFSQLPPGSSVGASSNRRKQQIGYLRPDLAIVSVRGNIGERVSLVETGKIDALIVAHAALIRLGLETKIAELLNPYDFPAHPKQGSLSLVTTEDRWQELKSTLSEPAQATGN